MKFTLRIIGIAEEEDFSREAKIDEALSSVPMPHTKAQVEKLYQQFPEEFYISLSVLVRDSSGKRIGNLGMRAEQWPGEVKIGAECNLVSEL